VLTLVAVDKTAIGVRSAFPLVAALPGGPSARRALARAGAEAEPLHGLWARRLEGRPVAAIRAEVQLRGATLLVIGSHGYGRATGAVLRLVGGALLHSSSCSALVARPERDARWPREIVVGVDGSYQSAVAADAAHGVGDRFGTPVRVERARRHPVDLLVECSPGRPTSSSSAAAGFGVRGRSGA
jgi:nucleotide-binding universal stress UspA family protein